MSTAQEREAQTSTLYVCEFTCAERLPHVEAFHSIASAQAALPRLALGRSKLKARLTPWIKHESAQHFPLVGFIPSWTRGESFDLSAPL